MQMADADNRSPPAGSRFGGVYQMCFNRISKRSSQKKTSTETGETGLSNEGHSCFANCVLQALLNTPQFASLYNRLVLRPYINAQNLRGSKGALTGCLSAVADFFWSGNYYHLNTKAFLDVFANEVNHEFNGSEEEDAHEFQTLLLDKLAEDVNMVTNPIPFEQNYTARSLLLDARTMTGYAENFQEQQRKFSSSVVNDIFKLVSCTITTCPQCSMARINFEEHNHLSVSIDPSTTDEPKCKRTQSDSALQQKTDAVVPRLIKKLKAKQLYGPFPRDVTQPSKAKGRGGGTSIEESTSELSPVSLDQCLAQHFEETFIEANCSTCGKLLPSPKSHYLWTLPVIIIVQLKRFDFKDGQTVKNSRRVNFKLDDLDMRPYLHPAIKDKTKQTLYSLYAIVVHNGNAQSGHYTARVKNLDRADDIWHVFDDVNQRVIAKTEVEGCNAYMLYYVLNGAPKRLNNLKELCDPGSNEDKRKVKKRS